MAWHVDYMVYLCCILFADDNNDILLVSRYLIKLQLMLNIWFDFGYENDLICIAKKSVSFAIGELLKVASRAQIDWVEVCCYLGVNIWSGNYFCTNCGERRKFCAAANGVISNKYALSKEFYTHFMSYNVFQDLNLLRAFWDIFLYVTFRYLY